MNSWIPGVTDRWKIVSEPIAYWTRGIPDAPNSPTLMLALPLAAR